MKRSKSVRQGVLCAWHGDKLVRASKRSRKIAGVWVDADIVVVVDERLHQHEINIPAGLQIYGKCLAWVYAQGRA